MPFVWLLAGLALSALSVLIMPKPKQPSNSQNPQKMDNPTADASKPAAILFGEMAVKSPNIGWYGDKQTREREVNA